MSPILALDAAGPRAGVALLDETGTLRARQTVDATQGLSEYLPQLLEAVLAAAEVRPLCVAVTVGPGSFTGLRSAIALAQGYATAAGLPLLGVPVGEAFAAAFPALHRPLWVALRARRDRLFIVREGRAEAFADAAIPRPDGPVALAGDTAREVAARLAAAGHDVLLTDGRLIDPVWVARAALAREASGLPPHPAMPLYVDAPEARLPAGLRAAPE